MTCKKIVALFVATALMGLTTGCGADATGVISGKVMWGDQPLPAATVVFRGADNQITQASLTNGEFSVELPVGPTQVAIHPYQPSRMMAPPTGPVAPAPAPAVTEMPPVPARYADFATSGLTLTVEPGEQTFQVDLAMP